MKRSPTATRVDVTGSLPDLTKRPTVYIDVDETILAVIWEGSGFDLRPNVMTQLRVLKELYNVRWLTWKVRPTGIGWRTPSTAMTGIASRKLAWNTAISRSPPEEPTGSPMR